MPSFLRTAIIASGLIALKAAAQPCTGTWSEQFLVMDQSPYNLAKCGSPLPTLRGAASYDPDGAAPATLVVTGNFACVGGTPAYAAARWNGKTWEPLGTLGSTATGLGATVFDEDGPGPFPAALYTIGGWGGVSRWNEFSWSNVGTTFYISINSGVGNVLADATKIARLRLGNSDALFVAQHYGTSSAAGSNDSGRLFQLTNGSWQQIPANPSLGTISALGSLNVGSPLGAGVLIAHQNVYFHFPPSSYTTLVSLLTPNGQIQDLVSHSGIFWATPTEEFSTVAGFDPDGPGPLPQKAYVGGHFAIGAQPVANQVAQIDNGTLTNISGVCDGEITQLTVIDDDGPGPHGPALFAVGPFTTIGGIQCSSIARWDGSTWSALGNGLTYFGSPLNASNSASLSLTVVDDDGPGPRVPSLFAVGNFDHAGYTAAYGVARWDGQYWMTIGNTVSNNVRALLPTTLQSTPQLFVAGDFVRVNGIPASSIASWDGQSWNTLGEGANYHVHALISFDSSVIAGGGFTSISGVIASRIAKWNGATWSALGSGVDGDVNALATLNGQLVAGGAFANAGGQPAAHIALWNSNSWSALAAGMNNDVDALAVFADQLYAGGKFTIAGGQPAQGLARWNGTSWSPVGSGLNGTVSALSTHDDGRGPGLFVGGTFTSAGGTPASNIARWNGTSWSTVGAGIGGNRVSVLTSIDEDGPGPRSPVLYVGGDFQSAGGNPAHRLARWDGSSWTELNGGADDEVLAISPGSSATPGVYVGGRFLHVGALNIPTGNLARFDPCSASFCYANCDNSTTPPTLNVNDFQCFLNRFAAGDPYANCDQSSAPPILNINDFQCFLNQFALGCP